MPSLTSSAELYQATVQQLLERPLTKRSDQETLKELEAAEPHSASALETGFRNAFYNILGYYDIDAPEFAQMWQLLDIVNIASDAELCDPSVLFLLIEELLDSQTIYGCRKVFDYLESRHERLIAKHWKSKHLVILRSCNELLRRLSRAEDTVFCGRVFIFLFQSFPLGDKSSVNLRGEYHTDNVTQYDQSTNIEGAADQMDVDDANQQNDTISSNGPPTIKVEGDETIDTNALYPTFWALQEYFAQPTKLFDQSNLSKFETGLEATMKKFREVYRDEPRSTSGQSDGIRGAQCTSDGLDGSAFNPKYLTSKDLFELEIHDPAFRRHVLVQALIVTDFLLSQTAKAKAKLENLRNRSVIYDFVLGEKDAQWAANMRGEIAAYLQQGSEGKFYYRMVDTVLCRDKNWLLWKAESCPPFQLDPTGAENCAEALSSVQKAAAPRAIRKAPLGALPLDFLEDRDEADPLAKFRDPSRWKTPAINDFHGPLMDADFDIDTARSEEDKQAAKDAKSSKLWRALRIGGKFSILDKLDDGNNLDPLFGIKRDEEETEEDRESGVKTNGAENTDVQIDDTAEGDAKMAEDEQGVTLPVSADLRDPEDEKPGIAEGDDQHATKDIAEAGEKDGENDGETAEDDSLKMEET